MKILYLHKIPWKFIRSLSGGHNESPIATKDYHFKIFVLLILYDQWQEGSTECYDVIKWKYFSALLALCAENPPFTGEFPSQRPVT